MGWNDHYCPSEYDPTDPDSMHDLALRSLRDNAKPAPAPDPNGPDVGECWDCGRTSKIVGKGMCSWCWLADNC